MKKRFREILIWLCLAAWAVPCAASVIISTPGGTTLNTSSDININTVTAATGTFNGVVIEQADGVGGGLTTEGMVGIGVGFPDSQIAVMATDDRVVAKFIGNASQTEDIIQGTDSVGNNLFRVGNDGTILTATATVIIQTAHTPATSGEACVTGSINWDASFIYVCVATNTWKKAAIASW